MVDGAVFVCFTKMLSSSLIALRLFRWLVAIASFPFRREMPFETPCGGSGHWQGHVGIWNDRMECMQPQIVIFAEVSSILACHKRDL
jgi:hypothetical protein